MIRLCVRLFCLVVSLLFLGVRPGLAVEPDPGNVRLLEQQQKIQRIRKGIEGQESRLKTTQAKENNLSAELDRLNARIQSDGEALVRLKDSFAKHEARLAAMQKESFRARQEKEQAREHIQKRLVAFHKLGPLGAMNLLFARESLPDILVFREYFDRILRFDREAILRYREKIRAAEEARQSLEKEKLALLEAIDRIKQQEQQLTAARSERMTLLARVKTEKTLYQAALTELGRAADRLTGTLEELKAEAAKNRQKKESSESGKGRRPDSRGFAGRKGRLSPPVPGTVTTLFGRRSHGKFGMAGFVSGIDIKAPPGAEIIAIHEGEVVFAGVMRGYGNLLIIDHGQQYYSLVSRAARFTKKEGDLVARGEVIGLVGGQEGLLGEEGLHFEIRNGTKAEDPLQWVNNAKLTIRPAQREKDN